jgi:SAM-dependent methyltransferase
MIVGGPAQELIGYCDEHWRRFLYTWGLARDLNGVGLELGSNPYFTTALLRTFTKIQLTCANYFGSPDPLGEQKVQWLNGSVETIRYHNFNIEAMKFPFADATFDVVFFCEILEHLQNDPREALLEIKRVLRRGRTLILTTPNVNRLDNVARMLAGANIYDAYSAYGPLGRHNREYNKRELSLLLPACGFEVDVMYSADVYANHRNHYLRVLSKLLRGRGHDLGQYIFVRARSTGPARNKRPRWLYRSYPDGELE